MNKWLVATAVMIPTIMEIMDMSVANVSLNHIQGSLSAGAEEVTWVLTSYLVSNAIVIPASGWLAGTFGRKRLLLVSLVLFTVSSLLCAAAPNLPSLVAFRVFQGLGGGSLQPVSQAILLETFPVAERGLAMAVFGVGVMFAPIVGPLVGGWLTDNLGWRWIFYINLPIGALAVLMALAFVHDPPYIRRAHRRVDYPGLGLLALGIGCLQLVLDTGQREDWFASPFIVRTTGVAVLALSGLVWWELRQKDPIIDLTVFRDRSFAAGNMMMCLTFFSFFGSLVMVPLYLQMLMGYTATLAGVVLSPGGVASLVAMALVGRLMLSMDARWVLAAGMTLTGVSFDMMAHYTLQSDLYAVLLPRIIQGFGIGMVFVPLTSLTVADIAPQRMGNATALFNLLRNLGGSFGIAFSATMLARRSQAGQVHLAAHLSPFDPPLQIAADNLSRILGVLDQVPALAREKSLAFLYRSLLEQSLMLGFRDVFACLTGVFVLAGLFFFFLRGLRHAEAVALH